MSVLQTLAIETSCDDTSLGIVRFENGLFSCDILKTHSQIANHQQYGGVVPELAYRLHEEEILKLVQIIGYDTIRECELITVTKEPGLPGSLVVGNTVASMLGSFLQKPIARVNHIYGHIFSLLLDRCVQELAFPWIILTASGGHNELYLVKDGSPWSVVKIGYSLDDAAGESFDKVSRMLGGEYPWGPWISKMAQWSTDGGQWHFKRILLDDENISNFSFSGMKSQVYQLLQKHPLQTLNEQDIADICRAFQECVTDILVTKLQWAAQVHDARTIGLVWGVSANDRLYEKAQAMPLEGNNACQILRPTKKVYSTDNAAMIGVVGLLQHMGLVSL